MKKVINVPDTPHHEFLKGEWAEKFGDEEVKEGLIRLGIADSKHKATRLLNKDEWDAGQLTKLGDALQIDWFWDFLDKYDVPTGISLPQATALRRNMGEVFQPVAIAS